MKKNQIALFTVAMILALSMLLVNGEDEQNRRNLGTTGVSVTSNL